MTLEQLVNRRTQELYSSTRSEILISTGAALFFVAVIAWRLSFIRQPLPMAGFAAVIAWVLISLYRFRRDLWRREPPRADALAATGREHYRSELKHRRDHLRNAWLWHGPLLLAVLIVILSFAGKAFPGFDRIRNALPLVILLAAWTAAGILRRRRQAREIQREIDELERP